MSMTHAKNQVKLGELLFFFKSPKEGDVLDCLILGHGGWKASDGDFALTAGLTMNFYVGHGKSLPTEQEWLIEGPKRGVNAPTSERITAPGDVHNYSLGKSLGSGSDQPEGRRMTYLKVAQAQESVSTEKWCPHVVTVRNRHKQSKIVLLRDVVAAVLRHQSNIRNFYYGACRGLMAEHAAEP